MPLVLHLGAPKCGSSALQTALSASPELRAPDGRFIRYGVILPDGRVSRIGHHSAARTVTGYHASASAKTLVQNNVTALTGSRPARNETLVLSNEDWLVSPFTLPDLAAAFARDITVVVYLRPSPGWWNAAWWQWWAWSDIDFERCFDRQLVWSAALQMWKARLPQARFRFRVLPGDVVVDFFENVLGIPKPDATAAQPNRGLPGVILRLYQRNRILRPAPDDHMIDFILSRRLNLSGAAPWVLGPGRIARMLERSGPESRAIQRMLDSDAAEAMENDERWWRPRAYAHLSAEPHAPQEIDAAALVGLHQQLCAATRRGWSRGTPPRDAAKIEAECVDMILDLKRESGVA